MWVRPQHGQRARPLLDRQRLATEALRLLDQDGVDALSMRRLAASLGVAAASLYTHVATRDELVELVVDQIYGELTLPDLHDAVGWRECLVMCAKDLRGAMLRHPWFASVLGGTGMANFGPNLMRLSESILARLTSAGFSVVEANSMLTAVFSYAIGATTTEAAWQAKLHSTGQTDEQMVERIWPEVQAAVADHPNLRMLFRTDKPGIGRPSREEEFSYGLERLLAGLSEP